MDTAPWMDWVLGGLAAAILLGGLVMLLSGVRELDR